MLKLGVCQYSSSAKSLTSRLYSLTTRNHMTGARARLCSKIENACRVCFLSNFHLQTATAQTWPKFVTYVTICNCVTNGYFFFFFFDCCFSTLMCFIIYLNSWWHHHSANHVLNSWSQWVQWLVRGQLQEKIQKMSCLWPIFTAEKLTLKSFSALILSHSQFIIKCAAYHRILSLNLRSYVNDEVTRSPACYYIARHSFPVGWPLSPQERSDTGKI